MSIQEKNKQLMKTLDDAWNSQETFKNRHAENVAVFWPGHNTAHIESDAENIDFPDSFFDAVLCRWGLMLLPNLDAALRAYPKNR